MPASATPAPAYVAEYKAFFAATGWDAFLNAYE
jgi:hypothetical protein